MAKGTVIAMRTSEDYAERVRRIAGEMNLNVSDLLKVACDAYIYKADEVDRVETVIGNSIQLSDARIEQMVTARLKEAEDKIVARIIKRFNEMVITQ